MLAAKVGGRRRMRNENKNQKSQIPFLSITTMP
jgi:hypothetical protein